MGFVTLPLTLILVSVDVPEGTNAVGLVVLPGALVLGSIGPDLGAETMSHLALPFAFVLGTVIKDILVALFTILKIIRFRILRRSIPSLFFLGFNKVIGAL